ncbi:hypothetical protein BDN67DRAFT_970920 [Paxillus ammoniavirescens]|nr:hypothetical protein BDN67DRAFT_970920 [Paxillus ammoniavirescens]
MSNVTVLNICCSEFGAIGNGVAVSTSAIGPGPGWTSLSTCEWQATDNATAWVDMSNWFHCANQFANTTANAGCDGPMYSGDVRTVELKGHLKLVILLTLIGLVVQTVLVVQ